MFPRRVVVSASILALLLTITIPVDAAPALQQGDHSTYDVSASISFLESCDALGTSTPGVIICPMIASFPMSTNITGTIGWTVTDLASTTTSLNVTRDLTISNGDSTRPVIPSVGSSKESIDLATRLVSFFPSIMPEMDQFLQMAQTAGANLSGVNLTASMPLLDSIIPHQMFYTMWWVNGPLKLNETVPVLVLPTNVTRSSSMDVGALGAREAWALTFNFSRAMSDPVPAAPSNSLISDNLQLSFVFDYDKTSDILLSATASVHLGFQNEIIVPPTPCGPSSTTCPATSNPTTLLTSSGLNLDATLRLSSTTVDLSHRMSQTAPPQDNGGSQSSGGSSNGSGSGTNSGSGSSGGNNGVSSNSGNNGATGSSGQPSSNANQPGNGAQLMGIHIWIYDLLGVFAAIVIGSAIWISRRRLKKSA